MHSKLLVAAGTLFVGLGILGIFLPILPTTPFLLLAAACYARGSQRFHRWLLNHRYLGSYIRNYREGRGLTLRAKAFTLLLLWITLSYSAFVAVDLMPVKVILLAIAAGVTWHLLSLPTLR